MTLDTPEIDYNWQVITFIINFYLYKMYKFSISSQQLITSLWVWEGGLGIKCSLLRLSSVGKEPACSAGYLGSTPGSGRSPGEGNGNALQYSCLENPMDRGAWQATVHRVTRVGHDLVTKPPPPPAKTEHKQFNFVLLKLEKSDNRRY